MLFITEIRNAAKRIAAQAYMASQESVAIAFGEQFAAGAIVKQGPVRPQKNCAGFELRVVSDGALVTLVVTIAPGMPESDVWCAWAWALEGCGLRVHADAAYQASCFAAVELEEERLNCS